LSYTSFSILGFLSLGPNLNTAVYYNPMSKEYLFLIPVNLSRSIDKSQAQKLSGTTNFGLTGFFGSFALHLGQSVSPTKENNGLSNPKTLFPFL